VPESKKQVSISIKDVDNIEEDIIREEIDVGDGENPFTPYNNNLAVGRHISFGQAADDTIQAGLVISATHVSNQDFYIK